MALIHITLTAYLIDLKVKFVFVGCLFILGYLGPV